MKMNAMSVKIRKSANARAMPPQRGAVTHHQDQSMTCVNLRTRNTMKSNPQKLMPPPVAVELLLLII